MRLDLFERRGIAAAAEVAFEETEHNSGSRVVTDAYVGKNLVREIRRSVLLQKYEI